MARENNLSKFLPNDEPSPEEERAVWRSGWFDEHGNYIADEWEPGITFYPWEWVYIPEILEYARDLGIEIPDGTIDFSKTF